MLKLIRALWNIKVVLAIWLIASLLATAVYLDPPVIAPLGLLWSGRDLTFDEAVALAEKLDRINDQLSMPPIERSEEALAALGLEIAPQFYYEGIAERTDLVPAFWYVYEGGRNFHVAGTYHWGLVFPVITLNVRYANPFSSRWYNDDDLLTTLVHEIGHAQGIVSFNDPLMEPVNQLATLEVLAGMTRERNAWALPAFVGQLERFATDYAYSLAFKEGRMADFRAFIRRRANSEYEVASFERSLDYWKQDIGALKKILALYGEKPLVLTIETLGKDNLTSQRFSMVPNACGCIKLNDTAWVLRHLQALADDYPELLAEYEATPTQ